MNDRIEPDDIELLEQCKTSEIQQDYRTAYTIYCRILEINPSHTLARFGKSRCAAQLLEESISHLDEACTESLLASQSSSVHDSEVITNTAHAIVHAVYTYILDTENKYQDQLFVKLEESSSRMSSSLFGGSLRQNKLYAINQKQNTEFQSLIPLISKAMTTSWSLSNSQDIANEILEISHHIKDNSLFSPKTQQLYKRAMDPLILSIREKYPNTRNPISKKKPPYVFYLFIITLIVAIGLLFLYSITNP